jgi:hypothetical protein
MKQLGYKIRLLGFFTGLPFILGLMATFYGCKQHTIRTVYPTLNDGRYDSEFPYRACSEQLTQLVKSIKKISCYTEYEVFIYAESAKRTLKNLETLDPAIGALNISKTHEAQAGTATVIASDAAGIALLSCYHIVDYPDTIVSYFKPEIAGNSEYVYSISIKRSQHIIVRDLSLLLNFNIVAYDKEADLVVLGTKDKPETLPPPIVYPLGKSKDTEWGSFVYAIGYPLGQQMITKGIVSNPNFDGEGSFLIDAPFNTGFSGGLILAIKDGVPNFEIVGLGKSVSANYEYFLKPAKGRHEMVYNPNLPYEDDIYVSLKKELNYGITNVISTEKLHKFYQQHKKQIHGKGYDLDAFFKE